ncbi:MAG: methylmalonyl-CoA mutase family protein, partial [Cyclobacteriaceae bacterium]|nr:methylmalonyl-CoA mutase family protein [Cyclobacteriaceae bacterium]
MQETAPYLPKNKVRIVTAASLFDGHDASINIMRRIIQSTGCEVIHLGHDRSAEEIVNCAIQEDAQAIAITSYQGGHMEFFKYMYDLLQQKGSDEIMLFGGGGGVILPEEIQELHQYGITRIYSPDDGRMMGLQGMINDLVAKCDFPKGEKAGDLISLLPQGSHQHIAQLISTAENNPDYFNGHLTEIKNISSQKTIPVIGITGTGGSGKSSLVDELIRRFLDEYKTKKPGIISVDPSKRKTGGALLGDRIRMNAIDSPRVFMRSMATRRSHQALSQHIDSSIEILKAAGYDLIILETSGIGQSDSEITDHCDISVYVMTPEYGAASQLEKIDMLDFADLVAINKSDKRGAPDALRDVKKQYQRNHNLFHESVEDMPVFTTTASLFNDTGTTLFYHALIARINERFPALLDIPEKQPAIHTSIKGIVPPERVRYLSEISHTIRQYNKTAKEQADLADQLYSLKNVLNLLEENEAEPLTRKANQLEKLLTSENMETIEQWERKKQKYRNAEYVFSVRGKEIRIATTTKSLSNQDIPKIALPRYRSWGDIVQWTLQENVPGEFPYTAGLYPFKREGEDPTRMFAGEGGPERTNRRFHYLSKGMPAKRLSTAFDSVTLYGHDPDRRPDIYGKIGNSGVSVCCLDDAKKLYSGFDLCHPGTSVSMTINGPAPMLLACFMNAAIDQQCELYIRKEGLEEKTRKTIEKAYQEKDLPV